MFEECFNKLMNDEGFFSSNPIDKGGATIFGISSVYHPQTFQHIKQLYQSGYKTKALSSARAFYFSEYWNKLYSDMNINLAEKIFSFSVNCGKIKTIKLLQSTLNNYFKQSLLIDGIFGNKTLSVILSHDQNSIRSCFIFEIMNYYKSLTDRDKSQSAFLIGWFNRALSSL